MPRPSGLRVSASLAVGRGRTAELDIELLALCEETTKPSILKLSLLGAYIFEAQDH